MRNSFVNTFKYLRGRPARKNALHLLKARYCYKSIHKTFEKVV